MPDKLFDSFASPDNLKKAFDYVKSEIRGSSLPLDPFWVPGVKAIEKLGDAFFNSLSKLLLADAYVPDEAYFFAQHKENFAIRKLAMLTVVDRVVYQALFNPKILGLEMSNTAGLFSTYPGVVEEENRYLADYKKPYQGYWDLQKQCFDEYGMVYRGEYDVHCFYDNISHAVLFERLEQENIGSFRVRSLLQRLLTTWHSSGRGIPQGPEVSSVIANYYLNTVDALETKMPAGKVGYVRYLDDISILAVDESLLREWVEQLTYSLQEVDLVLNSKTKSEFVENTTYFDDRGTAPYQTREDEAYEGDFLEKAIKAAPELIGKIAGGLELSRPELSKLKYYLRARKDYSFTEEVIDLYPKLPSFAEVIARYLLPVSNELWLQTKILKLLTEGHLFRWQVLWLAKLLLIEKVKGSPSYFGVDFRKNDRWELRSMAWLAESIDGSTKLDISTLEGLIDRSENNFELGIYLSLLPHAGSIDQAKEVLSQFTTNDSLELQTVALSTLLDDEQIEEYAGSGKLFNHSTEPPPFSEAPARIIDNDVAQTLGLSYKTTHPRRRFVFELKAEGDEVIMMGSILDGRSFSAFKSSKSAFHRVMKTLLKLHLQYEPTVFRVFNQELLEQEHMTVGKKDEISSTDLIKSRRVLQPLGQEMIPHLLDFNQDGEFLVVSFRSALSEQDFENLPESTRSNALQLAKEFLMAVNTTTPL